MSDDQEEGGAASLKGLRLLTLDRGPEGYGFHMYTNKSLKGQYVKWVSPNGPADLAGLLPGDHVLYVDGFNVMEETHQKVVERIRTGGGKGKTLLVMDSETEKEMAKRGEEPDEANALVMIPRVPIKLPDNNDQETRTQAATAVYEVEETDGSADLDLPTLDMSAAIPPKKNTKRAQVKTRDWRSSIQAYNEL